MAVMLLMHEQEQSTTTDYRASVKESGALAAKANCAELQPCREQSLYKDEERKEMCLNNRVVGLCSSGFSADHIVLRPALRG